MFGDLRQPLTRRLQMIIGVPPTQKLLREAIDLRLDLDQAFVLRSGLRKHVCSAEGMIVQTALAITWILYLQRERGTMTEVRFRKDGVARLGGKMGVTRFGRAVVRLLAFAASVHTAVASDGTLERAKSLYASAAYDEALAELDRLEGDAAADDPTSIAQYRVFCLLALDRREEARSLIDRILHDRPLYMPSETEASPRIQSVFRDVRRQTLPKIVMERYASAKAAFERKDSRAAQQFDDVVALLDDPDVQGPAALNDLKEVASAFRDLARIVAAAGPPAEERSPPEPARQREEIPDIIYSAADTDVIPPVAQSQQVPPWRPSSRQEARQDYTGALRLLIDQSGAVVSATMSAGTRAAYDQALLRAARGWTFLPAQRQGRPVRYLKVIEIRLKPIAP